MPIINPMTPLISPFTVEPGEMMAMMLSPIRVIPTYSSALNFKATLATRGAAKTSTMTLMNPPMAELTVDIPIASPARPCWLSGYPSRHVAMAEGVPGIFIRIAEMEPPYTAPVYNPRRKANEITGPKPKVKGMNTAMVIVAVSTGRDPKMMPTNTPRKEERNIIGLVK